MAEKHRNKTLPVSQIKMGLMVGLNPGLCNRRVRGFAFSEGTSPRARGSTVKTGREVLRDMQGSLYTPRHKEAAGQGTKATHSSMLDDLIQSLRTSRCFGDDGKHDSKANLADLEGMLMVGGYNPAV